MRVYVHLAYGFDMRSWRRKWESGELLGVNDPTPYGYDRAEKHGVEVTFSEDTPERLPTRMLRQGLRFLLGFDLLHAWRNRHRLRDCDVVWTHTESNHLGIAAVMAVDPVIRRQTRPKLLAQSVWLFDNWHRMGIVRRTLFRRLIARADVLTVLSPLNAEIARKLFPDHQVELVLFGIPADGMVPPRIARRNDRLNVLSVGNDRHRDWDTLLRATEQLDTVNVKIVSQSLRQSAVQRFRRATLESPASNDDLMALYGWADVVVVPLTDNHHASGVTVCQESAVRGVPVIVSDVGGLRRYFDDSSVVFVPPRDADALRAALLDLKANPERRSALVGLAQERMGDAGLSSESFVREHVRISKSLVASGAARDG